MGRTKKWWVPDSAIGKKIRHLNDVYDPYGIYEDPGYPLNVLLPGEKQLKKEKDDGTDRPRNQE